MSEPDPSIVVVSDLAPLFAPRTAVRHKHQMSKAFTLVELLVCIAIVAILAGIITPVFNNAKKQAFVAQDTSSLHQAGISLELYAADHDGRLEFSVKTLNMAGYLPSNLGVSQLDGTQNGIANNIAFEIHKTLTHFNEQTEFFWSHPSFLTFGQFQEGYEKIFGDFPGRGWMVSISNCKPDVPGIYLGVVHGRYKRLMLDGSVTSRQTNWPKAPGTVGELFSYSPYLYFADIPSEQVGGFIGD